jgi:hypothetical protein
MFPTVKVFAVEQLSPLGGVAGLEESCRQKEKRRERPHKEKTIPFATQNRKRREETFSFRRFV